MSIFVVDKHSQKICRYTKDTVMTTPMSLVLNTKALTSSGIFMWDVLLPTAEDCLDMAKKELITKNLILRTEYEGQRMTSVAVYKVHPQFTGEHLAAFFMHHGQIFCANSDNLNGRWSFDMMLVRLAIFISNYLDFCGRKMSVIVNGRKPT